MIIYDQDLGNRSVANDIENILSVVSEIEGVDLINYKIAYQDSRAVFDGVKLLNGYPHIYSINKNSKEEIISYFNK